jgi:hypothetical protein
LKLSSLDGFSHKSVGKAAVHVQAVGFFENTMVVDVEGMNEATICTCPLG